MRALEVVDDLDEDLFANLDDLVWQLDVTLGQLGDVDEALDAVLDADEHAEGDQLGDLARHNLARWRGAGDACHGSSWVALSDRGTRSRSSNRRRGASTVTLANLDDLGRVVDISSGDSSGDIEPGRRRHRRIDERAEVDDGGETTPGAHLARFCRVCRKFVRPRTGCHSSHARQDKDHVVAGSCRAPMIFASISRPM